MKTRHIITGMAILALIAFSLSSCSKKDSAKSSGMNLMVKASTPAYNIPVQNNNHATPNPSLAIVNWDTAVMTVSRIQFDAEMMGGGEDGDSHEVEFSWTGPAVVDLFNAGSAIGNISIPAGKYEEIEFSVYGSKSDAGSNPVFYLSGTYTPPNGTATRLAFIVNEDIVIKTEKENITLTVTNANAISSIIKVYLDNLFSMIQPQDIAAATMTGGRIIISSTSNTELYHRILDNFGEGGLVEFEGEGD